MSVIEQPIPDFQGGVPHKKGQKYPYPPKGAHAFSPYWVGAFVGARSSGKTYGCARLLYQYQQHGLIDPDTGKPCAQRVVLISPSADANPVWTGLKHLAPEDIHDSYSEELLQTVIDDVRA